MCHFSPGTKLCRRCRNWATPLGPHKAHNSILTKVESAFSLQNRVSVSEFVGDLMIELLCAAPATNRHSFNSCHHTRTDNTVRRFSLLPKSCGQRSEKSLPPLITRRISCLLKKSRPKSKSSQPGISRKLGSFSPCERISSEGIASCAPMKPIVGDSIDVLIHPSGSCTGHFIVFPGHANSHCDRSHLVLRTLLSAPGSMKASASSTQPASHRSNDSDKRRTNPHVCSVGRPPHSR